jgi:predicted DCC family thiol-disulfide oxidoreductase YuxK
MGLVESGRIYWKSDAALRISRGLGWPWNLFAVFLIVPRFVRDGVYDFIAARRYRWFGKRETCMVATDDVRSRFLE